MSTATSTQQNDRLSVCLDDVRQLMASSLSQTSLRFLLPDSQGVMGRGKMLRSRLLFRVGSVADVAYSTLVHAAAAVEMIHAASLLHDDVIDGGILRRTHPAFWVERGIPGAILLGDLLLFKAMDIICQVEQGRLTPTLIQFTGEVCEAESEQELVFRGKPSDWQACVNIARRKTGALFAFAAYVCGGTDKILRETLREAGYAVGTAYQLSDDIFDANGDHASSDKTLGTDEARDKNTAANFLPENPDDPIRKIHEFCHGAEKALTPWPDIQKAWKHYMHQDLDPILKKNLQSFSG